MKNHKKIAARHSVTPARIIDASVLVLALYTYNNSPMLQGASWSVDEHAVWAEHRDAGLQIFRKYGVQLFDGFESHIYPLAESRGVRGLKTYAGRMRKVESRGVDSLSALNGFLEKLYPWLKKNSDLSDEVFTGRTSQAALQLATVVGMRDGLERLRALANIPTLSRLKRVQRWVEEAAAILGNPPKPIEVLVTEVTEAKDLGEKLKDIDDKIALNPGDGQGQDIEVLMQEREEILDNIETLAQGSQNPDAVRLISASAAAQENYTQKTAMGRQLGLSRAQESAMLATGKAIIAAGAGSGKCVRGDTLIQTSQGFIEIQDLGGHLDSGQDEPLELTVHGHSGPEKTSHIYRDGFGQTIRMTTRNGYELEATPAHRIYTLRNGEVVWSYMRDLEIGDYVCMDRRKGIFSETPFTRTQNRQTLIPQELTRDVATLLGYVVSEGYIRKNSFEISMFTSDKEQYQLLSAAVNTCNIPYTESIDNRKITPNRKPGKIIQFFRKDDIEALFDFGLKRCGSGDVEIPRGILKSPKVVVKSFLSALFDGDGCVENNTVSYTTASERLSTQLQTVLMAFGVVSRRKFRPNKGQGAYHIYITGDALRAFHAEIGFNLTEKQQKLSALAQKQSNTNVDIIPNVSGLCQNVVDAYKAQFGTTLTKHTSYGVFKNYRRGDRNPSHPGLLKFLDAYKLPENESWKKLKALCGTWFFEPIADLESCEATTYDFVVPKTHSFSANGFINHNTRVLAGKVAHHVLKDGVPINNIIATSFSKKSANELKHRINSYGAKVPANAKNIGTTHSVGLDLLRKHDPSFSGRILKDNESNKLLRMAMAQVQMLPADMRANINPPPADQSFFPPADSQGGAIDDAGIDSAPETQSQSSAERDWFDALDAAFQYWDWASNTWSGGARGYADRCAQFLRDILSRQSLPQDLSSGQKRWLNKIFAKAKSFGKPITYRVASKQPTTFKKLAMHMRKLLKMEKASQATQYKFAAGKRNSNKFYKTPANQWFNLGWPLMEASGKDNFSKIGPRRFSTAMGKLTGNMQSVGEAWNKSGKRWSNQVYMRPGKLSRGEEPPPFDALVAAVYGAYQWLKENAMEFRGGIDYSDMLVRSTGLLIANGGVRQNIQNQYSHILVDEAQDLNKCVSGDTLVTTPKGVVPIRNLAVGDTILSYDKGRVVYNQVLNKGESSWDWGYRITTSSGHTLTMSPNHQIYASKPEIPNGQMALYLMYREGMGFRIGTSTRPMRRTKKGSAGRATAERADCLWVLDINDPQDILYKEQAYSLRYGIPTYMFEGEVRGCDQERIDQIFEEFGKNGLKLLKEHNLNFHLPHWMRCGASRGRFNKRIVQLRAHGPLGSKFTMNWTGEDTYDLDLPIYEVKGGRKMVSKQAVSYEAVRRSALEVVKKTGGRLSETLHIENEKLPLLTASSLFPGMSVPVHHGGIDIAHSQMQGIQSLQGSNITLEEIESVEIVRGLDFWDITVESASNFFGNDILSHNCQHVMFGLIAGYINPATLKPNDDGSMNAECFAYIGDDKQCLDERSVVSTPEGPKVLKDLQAGDEVLAYRKGKIVPQTIKHAVPSGWDWGYKVTLDSGKSLTMSPNHKLWASPPILEESEVLTYLMYREDMGFRVGITSKGGRKKRGSGYLESFGGRAFLEKAEKLWVLGVHKNREDALYQEERMSLTYGIPTAVFNGKHRGLNQKRIEAIFNEFGSRGFKLLKDKHLSFNLPHWASQGYAKHGRNRRVIHLIAHTAQGCLVRMEWSDESLDAIVEQMPKRSTGDAFERKTNGTRRFRRYFSSYRKALACAEELSEIVGGYISHKLATPEGHLREITASGLHTSMCVPVHEEGVITLDEIVSIEKVSGSFIDLDVDDASNFIANDFLTHNSIYSFRGAEPEEFINKSDQSDAKGDFKTHILETNYRSGGMIVGAANQLIAHNKLEDPETGELVDLQIPMVCNVKPQSEGQGDIYTIPAPTHEDAASFTAEEIASLTQGDDAIMSLGVDGDHPTFGIAVRTNAEAFAYCAELAKKGVPFRSKVNIFGNATTKTLLRYIRLAQADASTEDINDAVLNLHMAPNFMLGAKFQEALRKKAKGNYFDWLDNGGWADIFTGRQEWRNDTVLAYVENLRRVRNEFGSLDPTEFLSSVFDLQGGDGKGLLDALKDRVRENEDEMDRLSQESMSEDGSVGDSEVEALALAPVQPLIAILETHGDIANALTYVNKLERANSNNHKQDKDDNPEPAVLVGTVHSWKGLECEHLYCPMAKGVFPSIYSEADPILMSQERRLAYVALTRGKDSVRVLTPAVNHLGKAAGASQFVREACIPGLGGADVEIGVPQKKASGPHQAQRDYFFSED